MSRVCWVVASQHETLTQFCFNIEEILSLARDDASIFINKYTTQHLVPWCYDVILITVCVIPSILLFDFVYLKKSNIIGIGYNLIIM